MRVGNLRDQSAFTLLVFVMLASVVSALPVQWPRSEGGNDHWYELVTGESCDWFTAAERAADLSHQGAAGHLVTVGSEHEQLFIEQNLLTSGLDIWTGATIFVDSSDLTGPWRWATGEQFSYANWAAGQPDGAAGRNVACLDASSGEWISAYPSLNYGQVPTCDYIVEYEPRLSLAGDVDSDNDVDIYDFLVLRGNYNQSGKRWADGDLDIDGDVDIYDFLILRSMYGTRRLVLDLGDGVEMLLMPVDAGTFMMGVPRGTSTCYGVDEPRHSVQLTQGYYVGIYEVTCEQYMAVTGQEPDSRNHGPEYPAHATWAHADAFCQALSAMTGLEISLPTEAQWECACRCGSTDRFYFGDDENLLSDYAWYGESVSSSTTHRVGLKLPNGYGLYDLLGNANEWAKNYFYGYTSATVVDPQGPTVPTYRITRGGWIGTQLDWTTCSSRVMSLHETDYSGFRIICSTHSH